MAKTTASKRSTKPSVANAPIQMLFIGNSFTNRNDLPGMLTRLAAAADPPRIIHSERIIANGMALKTHWKHGAALEAINGSRWEYVVLQEQSTLPLKNPKRMHESITLFDQAIRAAGARTVLYLTWARRHEFDRQSALSEAYTAIGKQLGSIVVPAGVAWQRALRLHPDLVLHDKDNSHPNVAGTFLAACMFYTTLFGHSPLGLTTTDLDSRALGPQLGATLQSVAAGFLDPAERRQ